MADNYKEIAYPLPVEDLLYVGPATSRKLRAIGIRTIGRLAECPVDVLVRRLGKMGAVLHTFANGRDVSPVQRSDHIPNIKSVGNSATTPRDLETEADVKLMLYLLAESVCARMRELVSRCTVVEIYVRDTQLNSIVRQRKLQAPSCSVNRAVARQVARAGRHVAIPTIVIASSEGMPVCAQKS